MSKEYFSPSSCINCKGTAKARVIIREFSGSDRGHHQCIRCKMSFDSNIEELLSENYNNQKITEIKSKREYQHHFVETWEIGEKESDDVYPRFSWEDNDEMRKGIADHIVTAIHKHRPDKEQHQILDVGCGTGFVSYEMSQVFGKQNVLGIDPSPTVERLTQRYGIATVQGTLDTVNLPDDSRDVVVIIGNLMLHRDLMFTLRESVRILRQDGILIIDYKNIKASSRILAAFVARMMPEKMGSHPVIQRNFVNMRYGLSRVHMDPILAKVGFMTLEEYSKPPRLLEFKNASSHQNGIKGVVWRVLNWIDGITDNRAWIHVIARKSNNASGRC